MSNSQHLPDCMMPDGADPCLGYRELLAERDGLKALASTLGNALMEFTPGGSEYFTKVRGEYYADVTACRNAIRDRIDTAARYVVKFGRECKEAEAALAEAIGLLRETRMPGGGSTLACPYGWTDRRDDFLANHPEPSP